MKEIKWNLQKSEGLKAMRGVSFEELLQGNLIGVKQHPNKSHQHILLFEFKGYIWVVPCVMNADEIFLKTLFPSRKYTNAYRKGGPR